MRALFTVAATGVALGIGLASGTGPASAHVHAEADDPAPGSPGMDDHEMTAQAALTADNTARWLAGDALTLAAAVAAALIPRRRT
jgi:hypothetical protein